MLVALSALQTTIGSKNIDVGVQTKYNAPTHELTTDNSSRTAGTRQRRQHSFSADSSHQQRKGRHEIVKPEFLYCELPGSRLVADNITRTPSSCLRGDSKAAAAGERNMTPEAMDMPAPAVRAGDRDSLGYPAMHLHSMVRA